MKFHKIFTLYKCIKEVHATSVHILKIYIPTEWDIQLNILSINTTTQQSQSPTQRRTQLILFNLTITKKFMIYVNFRLNNNNNKNENLDDAIGWFEIENRQKQTKKSIK